MISLLRGKVHHRTGPVITLDVGGVGYEVHCSRKCFERVSSDEEVTIVIHTDVKEDSIRLYGFADQLEKQVFLLLLKVKGVGAKSASDILSRIDKQELLRIIGSADSSRLCAIKGIGKKTAERIVLELKDQVAAFATSFQEGLFGQVKEGVPVDDAIAALQALGFSERDARKACNEAEQSGALKGVTGSGDVVKAVLRFI